MKLRLLLLLALLPAMLFGQTSQQKAWTVLDSALKEKSPDKRARAVHALSLLNKDAKAASLAEAALQDANPAVREAAAHALGKLRARKALPALRAALDDKETNVVLAAADALTEMNDAAAYQVYYAILTGERKTRHGVLVEQSKVLKDRKRMAQLGFEQGLGFVPFAGFGYSAVRAVMQDDVSPVRAEAAEALADDPDAGSTAALVQAAGDKSWMVRAAALAAIAKRGDPALLPQVEPALSDSKDTVQYVAAAAIIRLSAMKIRTKAAAR